MSDDYDWLLDKDTLPLEALRERERLEELERLRRIVADAQWENDDGDA